MGSIVNPSRIKALSDEIAEHTERIDNYISAHILPQPSFDPSGPKLADFAAYPPDIALSRQAVLADTQELNELLNGPMVIANMYSNTLVIPWQLICRYGIVAKVPRNGSISYEELASKTGVKKSVLRRILRHAIAWRIFQEKTPGYISHSAGSNLLAESQDAVDWVGANVEFLVPSLACTVDAITKWPDADENWQAGSMLANRTDVPKDSYYDFLAKDPERSRRFRGSMSFMNKNPGLSMRHVADNYEWGQWELVVDLEGSAGDAAFAIARKYPKVSVIVQDLPNTIADAQTESGLKVSFMEHDFFEQQPIKDADVYFFRWILHNWTDKYAVKILQALIPALKPGARIIIMDEVTPLPGTQPNSMERMKRTLDMGMLTLFNAKIREPDEWKELVSDADKQFRFVQIRHPEGSTLSLIEVEWRPE